MSRRLPASAISILAFGLYLGLIGLLLILAPNMLLGLVGEPPTKEVWIRLAGMLVLFMGFFYARAGSYPLYPFFRWTLVTRCAAAVFVTGFVLAGLVGPVILLFWLVDLAGALWTGLALHREGRLWTGKIESRS